MKKSDLIEVQKLLDSVKALDNKKYQILNKLRELVYDNLSETKERIMYGGIMFSLKDDFGGLFVYKNHVSFEFGYGYKLDDPKNVLEGKGQYRRHVKLKSINDIKTKGVNYFVEQLKEFEQ